MVAERQKTVFLTGATSGIGLATAELLAKKGYAIWGTTRSLDRAANQSHFHALEMRLENAASIEAAWNEALAQAGQIDIVIQNAGAGIFGSIEDVSLDDARWQWQVLVEGPLHLLQLAAEHLRPRREGMIIGVSSLAAELPMPFSAHYSAGKAAFSALLAGLSMELKPFGVRVVDLRPGDIRTAFNDHLPKTMPDNSAYLPWARQTWQKCATLMTEAPPPGLIAGAIEEIISRQNPPSITRRGTFFQATLGAVGVRFLPHRWLLNSIRDYYGLPDVDEREQTRK
jgi:NAD(P)-dependent dehydrogenase (short-subunit alcohol dehydrogenase family)